MERPALNSFTNQLRPVPYRTQQVVIMLGDGAALADCSAITHPMHTANEITGQTRYSWEYASLSGPVQRLACGAELSCQSDPEALHRDALVVLNWGRLRPAGEAELIAWVRRQFRVGNRFRLLGSAAFSLARAGLLSDIPVAGHWEWVETMKEMFPGVDAVDQLYTVTPRICSSTCSDATTELVVGLIADDQGDVIARKVQEQLNRPVCRPPSTPQSIPLARKYGSRNQTFLAVVDRIQKTFNEEISVQDLCNEFNISRRQLERIFADKAGTSPLRFIKDHRLQKAQNLLQLTDMSVLEVAIACGFPSDACFRTSFKRKFGVTPTQFA
jgi:transcriptional regulator GlxA family with amidase domain